MSLLRTTILAAAAAAAALAAGSAVSAQAQVERERGFGQIAFGYGGFGREGARERIGRTERRIGARSDRDGVAHRRTRVLRGAA